MTEITKAESWYEHLVNYMREHQHFTSGVLALVFFGAGLIYSLKDFTLWSTFFADAFITLVISIGSFIMCEMFITTLDLSSDLGDVRKRLPAEVMHRTELAANEIVADAKTAIRKTEVEVDAAVADVVDRSVAIASPHLRITLHPSPAKWFAIFAEALTDKDEGLREAAKEVDRAKRAISCRALFMDVQKYADAAEILLSERGASRWVESTTYYPNRELIELFGEINGKKSQVRDWILKVNAWAAKDPSRLVHRIHLFGPDGEKERSCKGDDLECLHLQSAQQFIDLLERNPAAKDFYLNHYVQPPGIKGQLTFAALELPRKGDGPPMLPPECILVDREVALMYDPHFCQLKIFFGDIAEQMGRVFAGGDKRCAPSGVMRDYLKNGGVTLAT